ncbi:hypothetical protein Aboo_0603 [Aciduliprofundum boonei T469]|uniref:Uncharacterized protein n=1 Tax=Aciduliprofundum boonei (strain DSM 19572 / T469) TaxID=439481 RepID=B5I9V4_ACIB4|nr:hypothetical protein Aboo_0603 [Aciduliprofundum boonei T469]EDY36743.1 hypothetical protein ABOONEI_1664 [Aciduliprofundum boonei T469]
MRIKKKRGATDEELFSLLLNEVLNDRAKKIWERIKEI